MCRFWGITSEMEMNAGIHQGERMNRILVVDDDEDFRVFCENELSEEGYLIYSVSSGQEALKFIDKDPKIDLIVLDIKMPSMDGTEVLEELRRRNITVPVIIYSGHADYRSNFETWLADAYLVKQSDLSELKEKIKEFLSPRNNRAVA